MKSLKGKKGLIVGLANEHSLAYGCARHFRAAGADLALTYLNAKTEPYVRPLAWALGSQITRACDVSVAGQLDAVFEEIAAKWGRLNFALHSIGYARAEDLHGRVVDCSADGLPWRCRFPFIRSCGWRSSPSLDGVRRCLLTMAITRRQSGPHYNVMGPVKAALEAAVRYMAVELGPQHIRVNALSPGPVPTRSGTGIAHFNELLERAAKQAPAHRLVTLDDVGALAAFLVSDAAKAVTGNIAYVDAGYHVLG